MILLNSRYAKNDHKLMADMQVFKIPGIPLSSKKLLPINYLCFF